MSTQIRPALDALARRELKDANSKFCPRFHSAHEGYSVLMEETEEAEEALIQVQHDLKSLWNRIKTDEYQIAKQFAGRLRESALDLASEAIQVAAMAQNFISSVPGNEV